MDHPGLRDRGRRPDLDRISRAPPSTAPSRLFPARSRRRAPPALPHLRPSIPIQCAIRHLSRSNHLFGGCAARSTRASLNSGRARECRPYSSGRRHQCLRHTRAVSGILGLFRPQRPVRRRPPSCAAPGAFPALDPLRFRSHPYWRKASVRSTSLASTHPFRPRRRESLSVRHFLSRPLLSHRFLAYSGSPSTRGLFPLSEKDLPRTIHTVRPNSVPLQRIPRIERELPINT